MSTLLTPTSDATSTTSHDKLLERLGSLEVNADQTMNQTTSNILRQVLDLIKTDETLRRDLNVAFARNESDESSRGVGNSSGSDPPMVPIDPSSEAAETPVKIEAADGVAFEDRDERASVADSSRVSNRFTLRPIRVMVNNTEYFVHEDIFKALFPYQDLPERDGVFDLPDNYNEPFVAALDFEYSGNNDALYQYLMADDLESLCEFAKDYGNMPLIAAILQVRGDELFNHGTLEWVSKIYGFFVEVPAFRDHFRGCLRTELLRRHGHGSSHFLVTSVVKTLSGVDTAMEDVSMVLHDLWDSSTETAHSLQAQLDAQDNVESNSDNNNDSGWRDAAHNGGWVCNDQNDHQAVNQGNNDNTDTGVKSSDRWPIISAADPLPRTDRPNTTSTWDMHPPSPTQPPPANPDPPHQCFWEHATSRHLTTPAFLPEPPPGTSSSDAVTADHATRLQKTSALARCINHWVNQQMHGLWFEAAAVATGVGCTVAEAGAALRELLDITVYMDSVSLGDIRYQSLSAKPKVVPFSTTFVGRWTT
ncbi:hypothetical protein Z517_06273 [Fonsecaea pedrosoi CBS 271.37]|uniref:Uncharacterized protein n=1 Tax=Fonsecaea pedrosoi CBS 271.37 TaxID=1442368 RepID=A0A0D2H4T6_9EURO|nr:uncharacterized protein Z517_06273 [Fonsecaea pedrosoi CBS 271.37]KIW79659.1 hypothetical protein Z517_06273 [Fonsecaea pedrosoi CBS 271.37]